MITKGLVTEWEYQKLRGLAEAGPFMVRFHNNMLDEASIGSMPSDT